MRKYLLLMALSGAAALAQEDGSVPPPASAPSPAEPKAAPAKAKRKARKAAKRQRKAKKKSHQAGIATPAPARAPASQGEELHVFNETTSFEALLTRREELSRAPAAIEIKGRVIGVRRDLALYAADDANNPQDIVLNVGTDSGLSEGMLMGVARKVPVLDPYRDNLQNELELVFAQVRIVHAQKDVAVARLEKILPTQEAPGVGIRAVMMGDYIVRKASL